MASTKADLLFAAEVLARNARLQLDPPKLVNGGRSAELMPNVDRAARYATAATTALQGASLASNVSASEIDEALGGMRDLLAEAGVLDLAAELPAGEFLQRAFRAMLAWRQEAMTAQAGLVGYDLLRELLCDLESDFRAAGTETAARLAGRIHGRLDEAEAVFKRAEGVADATE